MAHFIELGHYDSHLNRLSKTYRDRWSVMAESLDRYFPGVHRRQSFGGTSFWITGSDDLDAESLAISAQDEGILIEPGSVHFGGPEPRRNCFRLGFSAISSASITTGLARLAELIES